MKVTATVSLDADLWKRARQMAAELGISASALVELALRILLTCGSQTQQQPPSPPPSPLQQQTSQQSPPQLSENQWVQVLRSRR